MLLVLFTAIEYWYLCRI